MTTCGLDISEVMEMADFPGDTYTNLAPSTAANLAGVPAGTTFDNLTFQDVFDMLFYPYQYPAFTSFDLAGYASILEVGDIIAGPGNQSFTFADTNPINIQANTICVKDVTSPGSPDLLPLNNPNVSPVTVAFTGPITYAVDATHTWQIRGTNTLAGLFTTTHTIHWHWRYFYGPSALAGPLVEAQIEALVTTGLGTGFAGNYSFVAGMTYKYITYPSVWGLATTFKDSLTLLDVPMLPVYVVAVTNGFGATTNYNVHRTWNIINAAITIIVS